MDYKEDVEVLVDRLRARKDKLQGNLSRYRQKVEDEIEDVDAEIKFLSAFASGLDRAQPELAETQ